VLVRWLLALAFAVSFVLWAPRARAEEPTLSGTWNASGMSESWSTEEWGEACGPKPAPQGTGGGTVQITQTGGELAMSGGGRAFRTSECWEQMPGMTRTGHTGGTRGWQTQCATPANDARQAHVLTTIAATDNSISIRETGSYKWVVKGQNCSASVLRSRTLTLTQREGEAPPAALPPATAAAKPAPRCNGAPGEPARLEVHPGRKLLRPGERFGFRAVVVDAEGCAVSSRPAWHVVPGPLADKVTLEQTGAMAVADDAPEGHVEIAVAVGDARATVAVEIASASNYDALLAARSDAGDDEAAVAVIATGSIGGATGVASDVAKQRKTTFVVIVFGIAACLGFIGLVLARRGKHAPPPSSSESTDRGADSSRLSSMVPSERSSSISGPESGRASGPRSGSVAPAEVPEPAAEPGRRPREPKGKICPTCGERYRAEATFCGKDATQLVPLN
jgi:hypothetical protein